MSGIGIVILIVLVAVIAWPFLADRWRGLPDQDKAPGEMIDLPQGATHALWHGNARGPVIVAIHGLSTPSPVWDSVAEGLTGLGYRVLVYDLYGRGYSDNARGEQGPEFFVRQLTGVLDHYGLKEDVTLMGYSMGGAIATAFAAEHPERVKRVILVAPAGIEVIEDRGQKFARETPVLGDWLFAVQAPRRLRAGSSATASEVAGLTEIVAGEFDRRGYLRAVLSSMRSMVHLRQEEEHRAIGRAGIPVIAIWGEQDRRIPLRALGTLSLWNRAVKQEVVAGADHGLPHTHGTAVTGLLRDVLREDWQ